MNTTTTTDNIVTWLIRHKITASPTILESITREKPRSLKTPDLTDALKAVRTYRRWDLFSRTVLTCNAVLSLIVAVLFVLRPLGLAKSWQDILPQLLIVLSVSVAFYALVRNKAETLRPVSRSFRVVETWQRFMRIAHTHGLSELLCGEIEQLTVRYPQIKQWRGLRCEHIVGRRTCCAYTTAVKTASIDFVIVTANRLLAKYSVNSVHRLPETARTTLRELIWASAAIGGWHGHSYGDLYLLSMKLVHWQKGNQLFPVVKPDASELEYCRC